LRWWLAANAGDPASNTILAASGMAFLMINVISVLPSNFPAQRDMGIPIHKSIKKNDDLFTLRVTSA
jgi:hypothetical protein